MLFKQGLFFVGLANATPTCPSDTCWNVDASDASCVLDNDNCAAAVTCSETEMTITFDKHLFGTEDSSLASIFTTVSDTCMDLQVPRSDGGFKWTGVFGECGMAITTELDKIVMKKTITLGSTDAGINLGTQIYTTGGGSTAVTFTCKYDSSATAISDAYDVNTPVDVSGSVTEATGSFTDGLNIAYYTNGDFNDLMTEASEIGSTLYAKVTWDVTTLDLGFYVRSCDVYNVLDATLPGVSSADPKITIIQDSCYAGVVEATILPNRSGGLFVNNDAMFSYKSFSFDTDVTDKQKISCNIQFCTSVEACSTGPVHSSFSNSCPTDTAYNYGSA